MIGKSKWIIFETIGKAYALDIIEKLSQNPCRYSDLNGVCNIDKTLTKRLRELEKARLIETINKKNQKGRTFIYYQLTNKGEYLIQHLLKLKEAI